MKILVAGAGAMGSRFGYMLQKSGNDVLLVDTWKEHVEKIRKDGLSVTQDGQYLGQFNIPIAYPEEVEGTFDFIILFTKSMQLDSMLQSIKKVITKDTYILCLLNGLGHDKVLVNYLDKKHIFLGATRFSAGLNGPGNVIGHGSGLIELMLLEDSDDKKKNEIIEVLNQAELFSELSKKVFSSIWHKVSLNCVINTMTTLIDTNIGGYGDFSDHDKITQLILDEIQAVAIKEGIDYDRNYVETIITNLFTGNKRNHYPSLYQDMKNKRLTEIDYLNGAIADLGRKNGIKTPVCELITYLIHAKEFIQSNK
ncbi:Ketopantoate reductase ApbA/PanE family protein [Alteracholeplasma palmae J233]|uniref:2-dehydropantoate 2-reductase n=1 Tax=Alteracholeplasma palmae (strain ATCC 49389 / J233) TaxID=1318466 RepID=U4KL56_ALTPJ|nr:ketopantoate reductase family protein [Alteracholeplasma palmae]CCV64497.1 Ketopantoate reductase ApbA/PanE family protein [Alteracholeplasma palmae J233]